MKTKYIFLLFVIVALMQLLVPAKMIADQEDILETGTAFKFKTIPVDPSDPFRGKYIVLNYKLNSVKVTDSTLALKEKLYLYVKNDSLGYATVDQITSKLIDANSNYIIIKDYWYYAQQKELNFDLPFDRFYMKETKAKKAEDVYREALRDSLPNNIYGLVYIKEGDAVLKDVIVNNESIAKYVED